MKIASIDVYDDGSVRVSDQSSTKVFSKNVPYVSIYARFFNDANPNWTKSSEYNLTFLKLQERYANDCLKKQGYLFLNDVYEMIGLPRSKAGQVVGWLYHKDKPMGDNRVDFNLYADYNQNFINGIENTPLLDFNVDGCIVDKI